MVLEQAANWVGIADNPGFDSNLQIVIQAGLSKQWFYHENPLVLSPCQQVSTPDPHYQISNLKSEYINIKPNKIYYLSKYSINSP